jgi:hypothetical protein
MDAYAFALALGTAGPAAMTVLGCHHGHAPGRSGHGHHHSTHIRGADRGGAHRHHAGAGACAADHRVRRRRGDGGRGSHDPEHDERFQTVLAAQLVAKGDLAGLGEIVGPARRDGAEAPAPPTKLPARPGRAAGD